MLIQSWTVALKYSNRCFPIAMCCLIVRRLNLEIETNIVHTTHCVIGAFKKVYIEGILTGHVHFRWGWFFFRWDLKTPCIKKKNTNLKQKMTLIVISTIYHFWSSTLTTFWYSVFASLFSMVYTPPSIHKYIIFSEG